MASTQSLFPKAVNLYETIDPERNLWRNVLTVCTLAGFDHEYIRMKAKNFFKKKEKEHEKENMSKM